MRRLRALVYWSRTTYVPVSGFIVLCAWFAVCIAAVGWWLR